MLDKGRATYNMQDIRVTTQNNKPEPIPSRTLL